MRSSSFLNSRRNNAGASRSNAESRLGLPRPSLESMRTNRGNRSGGQPQSEAETDYDSYYDEDEDEHEAEALLSRKHGEASEAGGGGGRDPNTKTKANQKRGASATDQDIADEYAEQEKERKKKARRKVQQTITPEDLIKPKGLTVVRNGIAPRFHSFPDGSGSKAKYTNTTRSMAKFSRRLVSSYADWMESVTGGLSIHETQWKLRSLGSKTQVKQYLTDMRKSVRDDHVERLLGLEKAQRLLGQLDDYYNEEQQHSGDEDHENYDRETEAMEGTGGSTNPSLKSSPVITNPYANNSNNDNDNAQTPTARGPSVAVTPTNSANAKQNDPTGDKDEQQQQREDPLQRRLRLQKEHRARRHVLEDSDDEEEATFDDVVSQTTPKTDSNADANDDDSVSPARSATIKVSRRHVLDDDDSDDDNGNEELEMAKVDDGSTESNGQERQDGAAVIENIDQQNKSNDAADDGFTSESNVATTPTNTSIIKLDEKFQSVKALLEGKKTTDAPTSRPFEETEETMEREIDAATVVNKEEDSSPIHANDGENVHQKESSINENKSEDHNDTSKDQQLVTGSTTETSTDNETTVDGDGQASAAAVG